jgi:hypothetical protein
MSLAAAQERGCLRGWVRGRMIGGWGLWMIKAGAVFLGQISTCATDREEGCGR